MFKWTNTLIVNSNLDSSGKPKWSAQAEAKPIWVPVPLLPM